jgi:stage II sporulation protein D
LGGGFGHGIGMSQYAAGKMAEEGMTYDEIIKYFYKNIEIAKQ